MTDEFPATKEDAELAVHALHGILVALDWLDDGFLDDNVSAAQLKAARTELNLAGRLICERASERF